MTEALCLISCLLTIEAIFWLCSLNQKRDKTDDLKIIWMCFEV